MSGKTSVKLDRKGIVKKNLGKFVILGTCQGISKFDIQSTKLLQFLRGRSSQNSLIFSLLVCVYFLVFQTEC